MRLTIEAKLAYITRHKAGEPEFTSVILFRKTAKIHLTPFQVAKGLNEKVVIRKNGRSWKLHNFLADNVDKSISAEATCTLSHSQFTADLCKRLIRKGWTKGDVQCAMAQGYDIHAKLKEVKLRKASNKKNHKA